MRAAPRSSIGRFGFEWTVSAASPSPQPSPKGRGSKSALALALVLLAASPAFGQTSYPMLMSLKPIAVQIGATTEHEVSARYNLYGASQMFIAGTGVTGEVVPPEPKPEAKPEAKPGEAPAEPAKKPEMPKIKLRFTVAAEAVPGPRSFRVITPQGASTVGQLVLVRDPVIYEADKNDALADAQAVTLPATLCGAIEKAEDVDYFKFTVAANQALTFHVQSQRCENKIHDLQIHSDPILTLRNSTGTVLALNDNFFFGDPLLHYRFAAPGEYFLEIRDARYQGNVDWQYSIEVNDRPFVTNIHPARITPGTATRINLVGFNLPADPTALVTLPSDASEELEWINLPLAGGAVAAAPVIVSRLPEVVETQADNNLIAQAQPITLPAGISGCISQEGDIDCYSFDAKKDEVISFEVVARRRQSSLDSLFRLLNDKGGALLEIDDMNTGRHTYADSQSENWKAPADGKYVIELRDLHLGGGPDSVYFLKVAKSAPYFALDLDSDKTLLAPGAGAVIYARAYRKNGFAGEIQLGVEGLPPGVTAQCGKILASGKDGCIVLQAAADAPHGAANLKITGAASVPAADPAQPPLQLTAVAGPLQEIYMPGGGRSHYPVEMHTVSVGDVMDIKSVKLSTNAVTLKPGESQKIDITIERREGFKGNVTLDCVMQHLGGIFGDSLPPGVKLDDKNSQTLLSGEQSQGHITLVAAADAKPAEGQLVPMMANVSINFVMKYTYSSEPVKVTVAAP
ncbi:MAG TPA: PPC domain-containing protein [Pirellulales bacterium]|nr:PPC domain-containing protein [Pirellulales bacterium]